MPVQPFRQFFIKWNKNCCLSIDRLHLKALILLALSAMLRPSNVAPRSKHIFRRSALTVTEAGLEIFHYIKNDADRDGFRIVLRRASDSQLCPVDALQTYMARTVLQAGGHEGGVFISLVPPFQPLSTAAVTGILNWAIALAGLDNQTFSAKNFRPTGATAAVEAGMDPQQVQAIGRWKGSETFFKHYVHTNPSVHMTDAILSSG